MPLPTTPQINYQPQQTIQGAGQPETPQSVTINPEALAGLVKQALQSTIEENRAQSQAMQREQVEAARRQAQSKDMSQDPVFQTIAPVMGPAITAVNLKADNALDAVTFYGGNPEASKYRAEIEQMVQNSINSGRPTARESLWHLFRGNPANAPRLQADYDAHQKALAQISATVGAGGMGRGDAQGPAFQPDTPLQTMRDALKGVSF
jgi:hypothetical protein